MKEKLLEELLNIIQSTKDFALEQMPLVAKEIVKYGIVSSLAYCILAAIGMIVSYIIIKKILKGEDWFDHPEIVVPMMIFALGAVCFVINGNCLIKATVAPRLYIIDELRSGGCGR